LVIKRSIYITLALLISLTGAAVDISVPATAITIDNLGGEPNHAHLVILMYLLGYGISQIPIGILADRFGRKPILLTGLLVFTIAAIATSITSSINAFLFWRFTQGVGGAAGAVVARSIARDLTSGKDLQRLFTTLTSVLAFITMLAPFMGSLLIFLFDWRAVYSATIFMGLVSITLVYLFIPETWGTEQRNESIQKQFMFSIKAIGRTPIAIWSGLLASLHFFGYVSMLSGFTIVARDVYQLDSFVSGAIFTSGIFIYFIASLINRHLARTHSAKKLVGFAAIMYALAFVLLCIAYFNQPVSLPLFCMLFIPYLIGFGFLFANCTSMALEPLPNTAGFAAGIFGTTQICAGVLGAFLTSTFYDGTANSLLLVTMTASLLITMLFFVGSKRIAFSDGQL